MDQAVNMLSKRERFQQWRGSKSEDEQSILEVALLISEYVTSIKKLEVIKGEAKTKFKDFNQDNSRSWATAVFTKLFIDEAIAQLPETAAEEKSLLNNLSTLLTRLYDNWKSDTAKNINASVDAIEKLIAIDGIPFNDMKQYKTFIFSSYMLFQIISLSLNELDWASQKIASYFVNIEQMKLKFSGFLQKIEEKAYQLEQIEQRESGADKAKYDPIKYLLNKRYLKVLSHTPLLSDRSKPIKQNILVSLVELEKDIDRVALCFDHLIDQRNKKAEIEVKIENINKLVLAVQENDRKITGRKYFLDFIASHLQLYDALLENTDGTLKTQLLERKEQLEKVIESPDLSSGVIHGASWITSPITVVYRTAIPQMIQDVLSSALPATLDSDCKAKLKELAESCLSDLKKQLEKKESQIAAIQNRFFNQDEKMKRLIGHERSDKLLFLQKENDALKEAVQASNTLVVHIKENLHALNDLKSKRETLREFIRLHDTILVKICNFLSQYFSFFKTEKVQMIDEASNLKKQVNKLAVEYQNTIDQEILQIEQNPFFDEKIKNHIKRRLKAEDRDINQGESIPPNKQNVRLLMDNLSAMFTKKPHLVKEPPEDQKTKEIVLGFS